MSNKQFGIKLLPQGNYVYVDGLPIRLKFHDGYTFVPGKWFFLCFSYDNQKKRLRVHINSKLILEKTFDTVLDSFRITENFLSQSKFGQAGLFAGKIGDLNVWSKILNDNQIYEIFNCKEIKIYPNILNWSEAIIAIGPNITMQDIKVSPCRKYYEHGKDIVTFPIFLPMMQQKLPTKTCKTFGGKMTLPQNKSELLNLRQKLSNIDECQKIWLPIFQNNNGD